MMTNTILFLIKNESEIFQFIFESRDSESETKRYVHICNEDKNRNLHFRLPHLKFPRRRRLFFVFLACDDEAARKKTKKKL